MGGYKSYVVPDQFSPYIFIATLFVRLTREWETALLRREVKDKDFLEHYQRNQFRYENFSKHQIASEFNLCFYERGEDKITKIGKGNKIFLDVKNGIKIICNYFDFFYLPSGIKLENGRVLCQADTILQHYQVPGIFDFEFTDCPFANHDFSMLENHFDVSINTYSCLW